MSDRTPLLEQLARRNPVPQPADPPSDAWDLATVRRELMRRETAMDTLEQTPKTRPGAGPPRRGGWLIATAAFAAVIIVGLVAFAGGGDDSPSPTTVAAVDSSTEAPTTTTTTTTEPPTTEATTTTTEAVDLIAESDALMTAIYANDLAGIEALVSLRADTDFLVYFAGLVHELGELTNAEVLGWTCRETLASNVIRCEVDYVDDTARAAGFDQLTETWAVGFAVDGVQSASYGSDDDDPLGQGLEAMSEAHPEWFQAGGPCEGMWADGDPATCAPVWVGFVMERLAQSG